MARSPGLASGCLVSKGNGSAEAHSWAVLRLIAAQRDTDQALTGIPACVLERQQALPDEHKGRARPCLPIPFDQLLVADHSTAVTPSRTTVASVPVPAKATLFTGSWGLGFFHSIAHAQASALGSACVAPVQKALAPGMILAAG